MERRRFGILEEERDVLYAFVSSGRVLYVGKTTMPLGKRMYGYQRPGPVSVQTSLAMLEFGTGSRQGGP